MGKFGGELALLMTYVPKKIAMETHLFKDRMKGIQEHLTKSLLSHSLLTYLFGHYKLLQVLASANLRRHTS